MTGDSKNACLREEEVFRHSRVQCEIELTLKSGVCLMGDGLLNLVRNDRSYAETMSGESHHRWAGGRRGTFLSDSHE